MRSSIAVLRNVRNARTICIPVNPAKFTEVKISQLALFFSQVVHHIFKAKNVELLDAAIPFVTVGPLPGFDLL
jgi:hypothetical protein